jgi:hypothetical protein
VIDHAVGTLVEEFRKKASLNEEPLKLVLERAKVGDLPLAFPGKLLADAANDRLFIADSNHNRIVVAKLDGTLVETIGAVKQAPPTVRSIKRLSIARRVSRSTATISTSPTRKTI